MATKTVNFAKWIWQDYTGARWEQLSKANTWGTNDTSYCYLKGSDSKRNYRPKSVFYHYQIDGIDSSKYEISSVKFIVIFGRTSTKTNDLPSLKVFSGDNNAPYKKSPLYVTSSYRLLDNYYDFDYYTVQYDIRGVSIAQLKNIICELDWKRSKVKYDSVVSINRAKIIVNYALKNPKWALYSSISSSTATTNDKVAWKLTLKNSGYCSSNNSVKLSLPTGVTVVSSSGGGSYNNSTKTWTFSQICKGGSVTRTFYLKSSNVGVKTLTATNTSNYVVNKSVKQNVTFTQYIPPVQPKDTITYNFYDEHSFEKEVYQYFDIHIQGVKNRHVDEEYVCYNLIPSENVDLYLPLRATAELIDENNNIAELVTDPAIASDDNTLCFRLERVNDDFLVNVRVYMYLTDDTEGEITTVQGNERWPKEFDIYSKRGVKLFTDEAISRDKTYVPNSINVGVPNIWTIRAATTRNNFFDEKPETMEISIEDRIAYIGVIPLSRCHKADVTATAKNSLIENRYLNRAYYGKKGDYSEDIKMTLRLAWYDVATLEGLVEMDKPIPIDTIPYWPDGDPLNHRGWAEIYEVSNIKKINDMLYECDVGVKYLSHDINTRFTITEVKKITEATIQYYLAMIHNYNMDLLDIFKLNYYEFWNTLEDVNGDKIGSYSIDPNAFLRLERDLNKHSTYDIVFRNEVPVLRSGDYDGNFEMILKVLNKETNDVLFEHSYNNFLHYDLANQYAVNTADATSKYLNGSNYETLNFEKIGLGYDELSPLIEDRKVATHFNTMENVIIQHPQDQFEIFLLDTDNKGISSQVVEVKVEGSDGFKNRFNVMSDIYGRILFDVKYGNGDYIITLNYKETDKYRACSYSTNLSLNFDYEQYHFNYPNNVTVLSTDYPYIITLLDEEDNPVPNVMLHYSFKLIDGDYGYERTVTTDENGNATIPINWVNGTVILRVTMKGYTYESVVYQPVSFETEVNINVQ